MRVRKLGSVVGMVCALGVAMAACGSDDGDSMESSASSNPSGGGGTLYARLGGGDGIKTVVGDFVGRVVADPKINGYFLNGTVDGGRLGDCLVKQLGEATGGPEKYDCKSMKEVHQGLGISQQDFDDLAGHLVASLQGANVPQEDIDTIVGVLAPMAADIVEDKEGKSTVYQRVGRKPAISAVVEAFVGRVAANAEINGFFASGVDLDRLKTCLVRQVCSIDGPCKYGQEVDGEKGVGSSSPCKDMKTVHNGLKDGEGSGITVMDFNALAMDLLAELDAAGVAKEDQDAIVGVLGPMCKDIVDPAEVAMCPSG
jgi:truncated hemoglobin YjbI